MHLELQVKESTEWKVRNMSKSLPPKSSDYATEFQRLKRLRQRWSNLSQFSASQYQIVEVNSDTGKRVERILE